jgi:hypothetical protein
MGIGALFPFSRGHSEAGTIDHEPWSFGEEVIFHVPNPHTCVHAHKQNFVALLEALIFLCVSYTLFFYGIYPKILIHKLLVSKKIKMEPSLYGTLYFRKQKWQFETPKKFMYI